MKRPDTNRTLAPSVLTSALLCLALLARGDSARDTFKIPDAVPAPSDNAITPARVELGKMLFFDPRLSGPGTISCATCHNPSLGWSDGLPTAIGTGKAAISRKTPSIVNAAFNRLQMWDGRFPSLEEQAWGPLSSIGEMDGNNEQVLQKIQSIPGYKEEFEKAYPGRGITKATVGSAIASFERTIISKDSSFDRWQAGDESAVSTPAKRGFELFQGKANCIACHSGPNFTDQGFHNIGVANSRDEGRFAKVPVKVLHGAFKTPTLRDVARITPYMHNGAYKTLEQVIDHYDRGGDDRSNLDPNMRPLNLAAQEKSDLVEFLKSLTGKTEPVTLPILPH